MLLHGEGKLGPFRIYLITYVGKNLGWKPCVAYYVLPNYNTIIDVPLPGTGLFPYRKRFDRFHQIADCGLAILDSNIFNVGSFTIFPFAIFHWCRRLIKKVLTMKKWHWYFARFRILHLVHTNQFMETQGYLDRFLNNSKLRFLCIRMRILRNIRDSISIRYTYSHKQEKILGS